MVASHLADRYSDVATPTGGVATATLRVADHDIADAAPTGDLTMLGAPLGSILTLELDGSAAGLGLAADEMLLAALGRAIARTIGEGVVSVDVAGTGHPVLLSCASARRASATETLVAVHRTLTGPPPEPGLAAPEIAFNALGELAVPPCDVPVWDPQGHCRVLELRVYRTGGLMHLQWWFDVSRFFPSTVEELAEQFSLALIELTSEAIAPI